MAQGTLPTAVEAGTRLDVRAVHAEHADFVFRTLQRMGVPERHLDDALQDAFLVVHRRLHTFDQSSSVTTWLFGICLRIAAAYRRRAFWRRERPFERVPEPDVHGEQQNPEDLAAAGEARARLFELLAKLDPERRAVFFMFEIEGMSCADIAAMVGAPVGTIYSRLSAARSDFEKALARWQARKGQGGKS